MEQKAYPAFGYVLIRCATKPGGTIDDGQVKKNILKIDSVLPDGSAVVDQQKVFWLMMSGSHTMHNKTTGADEVRTPGWTNVVDVANVGEYEITVNEESTHICFSTGPGTPNTDNLPSLEVFRLPAGQTRTLPNGTKLYLGHGSLDAGGAVVGPMRQVRISTGDKAVTAIDDCYGWIFK